MVNYCRRLIPFEIRARDAETFEVQSRAADRILRGRAFQLEEPKRHIGRDESLVSRLIHEHAKASNFSPSYRRRIRATHHIARLIERQQRGRSTETRANLGVP